MDLESRVLIVDRSDEARQVLRTALERRGVRIYEASCAEAGLELARQHRPDLIVLDLEAQPADQAALPEQFADSAGPQEPALIVLGAIRRRDVPADRFIAKPYHYQPLISKIEQILQARSGLATAALRRVG